MGSIFRRPRRINVPRLILSECGVLYAAERAPHPQFHVMLGDRELDAAKGPAEAESSLHALTRLYPEWDLEIVESRWWLSDAPPVGILVNARPMRPDLPTAKALYIQMHRLANGQ